MGSREEIVSCANMVSEAVDALTKSMYPPIDDTDILTNATELVNAAEELVLVSKSDLCVPCQVILTLTRRPTTTGSIANKTNSTGSISLRGMFFTTSKCLLTQFRSIGIFTKLRLWSLSVTPKKRFIKHTTTPSLLSSPLTLDA